MTDKFYTNVLEWYGISGAIHGGSWRLFVDLSWVCYPMVSLRTTVCTTSGFVFSNGQQIF
ncbi:MAG: hypothetical protein ABR936_01380 [Bacteroidota bacterium]